LHFAILRFSSPMANGSMIDRTLPSIDLHRHLDGSVRLETILDSARQHDVELPATMVEELRPHLQERSLDRG
jgi:adenosine deaminase